MSGERAVTNAFGNTITTNAPIDIEGLGDITVGLTEVAIRSNRDNVSEEFRVRAATTNTGVIYIEKTGVLADGTNDFIRLEAGDEWTFRYNDIENPLFAISDVAAQSINVGVTLNV